MKIIIFIELCSYYNTFHFLCLHFLDAFFFPNFLYYLIFFFLDFLLYFLFLYINEYIPTQKTSCWCWSEWPQYQKHHADAGQSGHSYQIIEAILLWLVSCEMRLPCLIFQRIISPIWYIYISKTCMFNAYWPTRKNLWKAICMTDHSSAKSARKTSVDYSTNYWVWLVISHCCCKWIITLIVITSKKR